MESNEYVMQVDPLHRNVWPVTWHGREIGQVIEHITVTFDIPARPIVKWSWKLYIDPTDRTDTVGSRPRFDSHADALATLTRVHRATIASSEGGGA